MSREVRIIPEGWQHPRDASGHLIPLHDGFSKALADWTMRKEKWDTGLRDDFKGGWIPRKAEQLAMSFEQWTGAKPIAEEYMPEWPAEQRTHLMMYETCTEGTPISPAFRTPEELARWLADNAASSFGSMTATYEEWLATCQRGYAFGALMSSTHGFENGVSAMARLDKEKIS